eukprot:c14882_g1_i1.p1 GENE.c14882_g1_i1~~c14882_g1_i1.p1  ORF type:complete len:458 (+),score=115.78 c14882_g1_i1:191-1564(+)
MMIIIIIITILIIIVIIIVIESRISLLASLIFHVGIYLDLKWLPFDSGTFVDNSNFSELTPATATVLSLLITHNKNAEFVFAGGADAFATMISQAATIESFREFTSLGAFPFARFPAKFTIHQPQAEGSIALMFLISPSSVNSPEFSELGELGPWDTQTNSIVERLAVRVVHSDTPKTLADVWFNFLESVWDCVENHRKIPEITFEHQCGSAIHTILKQINQCTSEVGAPSNVEANLTGVRSRRKDTPIKRRDSDDEFPSGEHQSAKDLFDKLEEMTPAEVLQDLFRVWVEMALSVLTNCIGDKLGENVLESVRSEVADLPHSPEHADEFVESARDLVDLLRTNEQSICGYRCLTEAFPDKPELVCHLIRTGKIDLIHPPDFALVNRVFFENSNQMPKPCEREFIVRSSCNSETPTVHRFHALISEDSMQLSIALTQPRYQHRSDPQHLKPDVLPAT